MTQLRKKQWLLRTCAIVFWMTIWQLISMCVNNSILLVGPAETLKTLLMKASEFAFWQSILGSMLRIIAGFLAGWLLGLLLAACSGGCKWVEEMLWPIMSLVKTTPMASFVVLFLIWFRTGMLAVAVSMFVVLPIAYLNTLEGIKSTDIKLLEMAAVYKLHPIDTFFYIYRPTLKPFWNSCLKLSIGMSWKAGVAAEVIGTPDFSVGEQLYMSKIYLDTAGVLAWTMVIIVISVLCEKLFLGVWKKFMEWQQRCRGIVRKSSETGVGLSFSGISKTYGENLLFKEFNAKYEAGQIYYFRSPSGSGKTTLFRIIAGLEDSDAGVVLRSELPAYAFQEDRLCEDYSAIKNLELVCRNKEEAFGYLVPLLDEEDMHKPCNLLSGGMKRRVEVARAFAADRGIVLLDEPFAGLDEENRRKMQNYIEGYGKDKVVLIATHV